MFEQRGWRVENLRPDDAVTFPLLRIVGRVPLTANLAGIEARVLNAAPGSLASELQRPLWPVNSSTRCFVALVWLQPGVNQVALAATGSSPTVLFSVHYLALPWDYAVRAVYVIPSDAVDERFQAPEDEPSAVTSAVCRFAMALRLMQTAAGELLFQQGLGRSSFCVERMEDACACPLPAHQEQLHCVYEVPVHVRRLSRTRAELHAMTGDALWGYIAQELSSIPDRDQRIDVVVMSFTWKNPNTGEVYGHTALGGGFLALFGSSGMYSWPQNLTEVPKRFSDRRRVDGERFFDDSAGRGERWALAATSIGAMLHELGHCLSLPHPCQGGGIMARGFDYFYRLFTVHDVFPEHNGHEPYWDRSAACRLHFHPYFVGALAVVGNPVPSGVPVPVASPTPAIHTGSAATDGPGTYEQYANLVRLLPVTNGAAAKARPDHPLHASDRLPRVILDSNGLVHIWAANGIGHIGYYIDGDVAAHDEFIDSARPVEHFEIALHEICHRCHVSKPTSTLRISCIDHLGQMDDQFEHKVVK
ncbi:hypothetical protein F1559_002391 [Cyanidiococcus yangmingshanensis]|uniref:Zinc metalloproteinase n=1 Tax=Cyanidiococcus yangmingshanensis TaxID=2690220 RepID=A0A7J7ID92_9RHOD|nr:hypothetical protein F1559_002391 [Cyanidiococcus yangmingshanensis]